MKTDLRKFLPYSNKVGILEEKIEKYKKNYSRLWCKTEDEFPRFERIYSKREQEKIEDEVFRFVDWASLKLDDYTPEKENHRQKIWLEDFVSEAKKFGKKTLELSDISLESVFKEGFMDSTRMFVEKVKEFDPSLKTEEIYQALRNVWIMNSLQVYLNLDVKYLDSIFAYSMIYPYIDNYLDSTSEPIEKKISFLKKMKHWLEGKEASYMNLQEEKIYRLIKIIEKQYHRCSFPGVYQSLLAIFNAQLKSLAQQRNECLPYEIDLLDLSLEKGGTSVLADGFLVNGLLEDKYADFCFGFGVFLQLADDIQDITEDRENNHTTIFSQPAGRHNLDKLANKLFNFIAEVIDLKLDKKVENEKSLGELIIRNCYLLIMEAVGKNKAFYSQEYIKEIQRYFPIRFTRLKKLRKEIKEKILDKRKNVTDLDFISAFLLTLASRTISGK
ncbi:MAG: class 1 isoprenoid biosynthesis enzyme [Candidatus Aminicenantes bacterium]|nr:MAG: class 1 isoprenoid biosynthesis enzyme [Candidatus Aminicenantes bacterium]